MIIDFRVTVPLREWTADQANIEEAQQIFLNSYMRGYAESAYEVSAMYSVTSEDMVKAMDKAGVTCGVLQAEWALGNYRSLNDATYRIAKQYPEKFPRYFFTVNALEDDDMVEVVEREVKERGFTGINFQTWAQRMYPDDKRLYPVYAKCQELGIIVTIHSSINFTVDRTIDFSRPLYIDRIACDFPNLKIVGNHGGWPWVAEMVAVAWKHKNVYIEIGAVAPKYIGMPGTGWEPLMVYGNSLLQDRVLFATDDMIPWERAVRELQDLPLKDKVKEKWLSLNAARLLELS